MQTLKLLVQSRKTHVQGYFSVANVTHIFGISCGKQPSRVAHPYYPQYGIAQMCFSTNVSFKEKLTIES